MAEYINRNELLERMQKCYCGTCNNYSGMLCRSCLMDDALRDIEDAPAADVVEVKHGYWFDTYKGGSKKGCSVCHCQADLSKQGKEYCSYCGAKMDGERREV